MNKEWSEIIKAMQIQIKKEVTFNEGIEILLELHQRLTDELYRYASSLKDSTNGILINISFADLKRKMTDTDKEHLKTLSVVSENEKAYWLIDYWCGKDVGGLIKMPFPRHWIMHIEASLCIKNKVHLSGQID